jgi:sugar lactone lactonase YvrE
LALAACQTTLPTEFRTGFQTKAFTFVPRVRPPVPATGVTTTAGSTASLNGSADGAGTASRLFQPMGMSVDANGNLYVADTFNHRIRKVTPTGTVTTLAGSTKAFADGIGTAAKFNYPHGVAAGPDGTVYVADKGNNRVRAISPTGTVTTLAGSSATGNLDGAGSAAQFRSPWDVVVDPNTGNVFVSDSLNQMIRKITPGGAVSTFTTGLADPRGMGIAPDGSIYVAEPSAGQITKISPFGVPTPYATGLTEPWDVDIAGNGDIVVCEANQTGNSYKIKRITSGGTVSVLSGGAAGGTDGALASASYSLPKSVAIGNGVAYIADFGNNRVRSVSYGTYLANTYETGFVPEPPPAASSFTYVDYLSDYAAKAVGPAPDGVKDGHFRLQLTLPTGGTISSLQLTQDDGTGHVWDMDSSNGIWNLAVRNGATALNSSSVNSFTLGAGTYNLDIYCGSIDRCVDATFFNSDAEYTVTLVVGGQTLTAKTVAALANACPIATPTPSPQPLVPNMTSATSPSGRVFSSGTAYYNDWDVFNGNLTDFWDSSGLPTTIGYDWLGPSKTVIYYTVRYVWGNPSGAPKDWTLQGYNGSTWTVIDTVVGEPAWNTLGETRTYNVDAVGSYKQYKLVVTNHQGNTSGWVVIDEIQFYGY